MLISDWSSDVCSSDLEINQLVCPVRRHAGLRNERVVAAPNHVLGKDSRFRGQQRKHCDAQQSVGLDPGGGICRYPLQRLIRIGLLLREWADGSGYGLLIRTGRTEGARGGRHCVNKRRLGETT